MGSKYASIGARKKFYAALSPISRACAKSVHMPPVAKKPRKRLRTFFREWREFRGLKQNRVAEMLETEPSTLSRLETGKSPYDQDMLERLAEIYECEPGELLSTYPNNDEPATNNAPPEWTLQVVDWTLQALGHDKTETAVILGFVRELVSAPLTGIAAENPSFALRLRFEDAMRAFPARYSQEKAE
jgi:transcriptional regulator with XRE-family HTH domain